MISMKSFNLMAMMTILVAGASNLFGGSKGKGGKASSLYNPPKRPYSPVQPRTYESRMPLEAGHGLRLFSYETKFGTATIHADNSNSAGKHLRKLLGERFGFRTSFAKY